VSDQQAERDLGGAAPGVADGADGADGASATNASVSGAPLSIEDKERYLKLLDNAMARGLLDGEEYMDRAAAIDQAQSIDQLNRIVQEMPLLPMGGLGAQPPAATGVADPLGGAPVSSGAVGVGEGVKGGGNANLDANIEANLGTPLPAIDEDTKLDAVDLALLHRQSRAQTSTAAAMTNKRWLALVLVVVMFVILIVLGVVLAAHSKSVNNGSLAVVERPVSGDGFVNSELPRGSLGISLTAQESSSSSGWASPLPLPLPLVTSPLPVEP
jgi:hypothetical protein